MERHDTDQKTDLILHSLEHFFDQPVIHLSLAIHEVDGRRWRSFNETSSVDTGFMQEILEALHSVKKFIYIETLATSIRCEPNVGPRAHIGWSMKSLLRQIPGAKSRDD